jgi:hypothetical protein
MVKTKLNKRLYSIVNEMISLVFPKQSSLPLLNFLAFFNSHPSLARCSGWPSHPAKHDFTIEDQNDSYPKPSAMSSKGLIKIP